MKAASWLMLVVSCALVAAIVRDEPWRRTTAATGDVRATQTVDISTELRRLALSRDARPMRSGAAVEEARDPARAGLHQLAPGPT